MYPVSRILDTTCRVSQPNQTRSQKGKPFFPLSLSLCCRVIGKLLGLLDSLFPLLVLIELLGHADDFIPLLARNLVDAETRLLQQLHVLQRTVTPRLLEQAQRHDARELMLDFDVDEAPFAPVVRGAVIVVRVVINAGVP